MDLKGKNFLKLLDFSAEEIGCLIDLAAELKYKKAYRTRCAAVKTLRLFLKKQAQEPAAALRLRRTTSVWE